MKRTFKCTKILLTLVVALISISVFSSCSDEKFGSYSYSFGFTDSSVNASTAEMQAILDQYRKALSFTGYETSMAGTEEECNNKILAGCAQAEKIVDEMNLSGGYELRVVNNATYKEIYRRRFGSLKGSGETPKE